MTVTAEALKGQIAEAFAEIPYPGDDRIALHQCDECERIRHDLCGQAPSTLSEEILDRIALPLLSPEAFRYFISAYMCYTAEHYESSIAFFTRQSLGEAGADEFYLERFRLFTERQREVVISLLEFLRSQEIEGDDEDNREYREKIDADIKIWKELA